MKNTSFTKAQLLFHSGFEDGVIISNTSITGADSNLPAPNSWDDGGGLVNNDRFSSVSNLRGNGDWRNVFEYDTVNPNAFYGIDKVKDPADPNNNVMRFSINAMPAGDASGNGRLEHVIYGKWDDIRETSQEVYYKFDMYLSPDFEQFANYENEVGWMMILELWNDTNWNSRPFPYRVSVNLYKHSGLNQPFYISTRAQIAEGWFNAAGDWWYEPGSKSPPAGYTVRWGGNTVSDWFAVSDDPVPLAEWLTCEVYYKAGLKGEGEFYFAGTRQDGKKLVFCDKTGPDKGENGEDNRNITRHPQKQ